MHDCHGCYTWIRSWNKSSSPLSEKTSASGQVFWCSLKISSGSTAICATSACVRASPRAHLGTGFFSRSASSSESSLSEPLLHTSARRMSRLHHCQRSASSSESSLSEPLLHASARRVSGLHYRQSVQGCTRTCPTSCRAMLCREVVCKRKWLQ